MKFNRHVKQIVVSYFRKPLNPITEIINSYRNTWFSVLENLKDIGRVRYPILDLLQNLIIFVIIVPYICYNKTNLYIKRYRSSKKVKKYGIWIYIKKLIDKEIKL